MPADGGVHAINTYDCNVQSEMTIFFRARLGAYFIKQEEFLVHTKDD